ncbi:MAG TPA: hypothetical protein VN174_02040 [Candidatus Methanoperedens sp.]|nr:hypothetical protein [Candidatus Methanoperedens sp.]
MPKETNVLYVLAQNPDYNRSDKRPLLQGVLKRKDLLPFVDSNFLTNYLSEQPLPGIDDFSFDWYPRNAPGHFIAKQVQSPGKVIEEPITSEKMVEILAKEDYSHVYLASYLNGYQTFKEIASLVRQTDPSIHLIAGSNSALLPETRHFVDECLVGDSVMGMRRILHEPLDYARQPIIVPSDTTTTFHGMSKTTRYGLLITGFGCRYGCDFCPSTAQWGRKETYPISTEAIAMAIHQSQSKIGNSDREITLSLAEPQGLAGKKWEGVFTLCKDLPFKCNLVSTTSSKVITQFNIDTLTKGNMRLSTVNIGVESIIDGGYEKNSGVNLRELVKKLQGSGINVILTYIIGFYNQNREVILREVEQLKALGASGHIVANLELQPGTPLYQDFQQSGKLLPVPPELLAMPGYQSYHHPSFRTGFNDILPLLDEVNSLLDQSVFILGNDPLKQDIIFREKYRQIDLFHPYILTTN